MLWLAHGRARLSVARLSGANDASHNRMHVGGSIIVNHSAVYNLALLLLQYGFSSQNTDWLGWIVVLLQN